MTLCRFCDMVFLDISQKPGHIASMHSGQLIIFFCKSPLPITGIFLLRSNDLQTGYSLFCRLSRLFRKRGGSKTFPFLLITFPIKSLLLQKIFKTVQKVDKIVDIHSFENISFEKNLPVKEIMEMVILLTDLEVHWPMHFSLFLEEMSILMIVKNGQKVGQEVFGGQTYYKLPLMNLDILLDCLTLTIVRL